MTLPNIFLEAKLFESVKNSKKWFNFDFTPSVFWSNILCLMRLVCLKDKTFQLFLIDHMLFDHFALIVISDMQNFSKHTWFEE